ncbi:uncharacterized protein [Macrobrachium rosenbergii]|uniref:uncharacterized protein n=1 Tax=Macrobrachium rosenbergii TaxID=79674 RepID=UPI0034D72CC8
MKWIEGHTTTILTVKLQVTTPWGTLPHRLSMVSGIQPGVDFLLGRDLLWGSPSPTPLRSHTTSSTVGSPYQGTATLTGVPPQEEEPPSTHRSGQQKGHTQSNSRPSPPSPRKNSQQRGPPSPEGTFRRSNVQPPLEEDPVPDPDHETYPPPGGPGPVTALILATCEPLTPDISSSPNPSPEDEPLVDQTATPSLGAQDLASLDTGVETALAPVVAAARLGSPSVASEVTPDFAPASPSGLSPEPVPSSPTRTDIDRPWRNLNMKKKGQKRAK